TTDTTRFFISIHNDTVLIGNLTGLMKRPISDKIWWYEYDQFSGASRLVQIRRGAPQLDSIITDARKSLVNAAPLPVTERVRNMIKSFVGRKPT
ncbi:MAG: hypothetical protein RML40_11655, partial [Bacteroidota bacterium]|nr:hypothetical protein [Candidatus Kapabacteria bacterium]MDW8221172.1 hypothetical protein [Bacteroidota bacterium]